MSKVIKLNFTKKVRYIFDKETEENLQLGEKVLNHFGSFIDNSWEMSDLKRFHKVLRECGLSVSEFLAKEWPSPTPRPKKKPAVKKKPVVEKEPSEEKVPAKKKVVRKKFTSTSTKAKAKGKKK
ncbi:hypothetical protein YFHUAIHA_CDS0165 [Phage C48C1]|nr:hypothetical protein YFHUAIHA_CDS0165 [Phage C48C1]